MTTSFLGTDLIKDSARLQAAYDDASGVTAMFNKNVLFVLNRELGADFDPDAFEHVARYEATSRRGWISACAHSPPDRPPRATRPRRHLRRR